MKREIITDLLGSFAFSAVVAALYSVATGLVTFGVFVFILAIVWVSP